MTPASCLSDSRGTLSCSLLHASADQLFPLEIHLACSLQGINPAHTDFNAASGSSRLRTGYSYTTTSADCNGHGTHISGTAAGLTYGIAKGAYLHPGISKLLPVIQSPPAFALQASATAAAGLLLFGWEHAAAALALFHWTGHGRCSSPSIQICINSKVLLAEHAFSPRLAHWICAS